jgi:broad specificity phosphatase PhoE
MANQTKKLLYIIRHGETEFNRLNIVQGSGVDTHLNETGFNQAKKFHAFYKDIPFDTIYTSALIRTQQSVQPFIDSGISHQKLAELNEICWGDFEGKAQSEEQKLLFWNVVEKWKSGELHEKIPNGESPLELQNRQSIALNHIMQNTFEKTILICMHGRAIKSFLCLLLNIPLTKMDEFMHSNLGLYLLIFDGSSFELVKQNDTEHLN